MQSDMIETKILKIDKNEIDYELLNEAAKLLNGGGTCVFPTETVYGLGADALSVEAVAKIFRAKGRPQDNPLIAHISSLDMLLALCDEFPRDARRLSDVFWPGPLTLILKSREELNPVLTAGLKTVAVRMPSHPLAIELIKLANTPIAAPSANISGKPSPTRFEHVFEDLNGKVDMIIDGGDCEFGVESTVVDVTCDVPVVLRPGGITLEKLKEVIPDTVLYVHHAEEIKEENAKSPGLKHVHYAPSAPLYLVKGEWGRQLDIIFEKVTSFMQDNCNKGSIGFIVSEQTFCAIKERFNIYDQNTQKKGSFKFVAIDNGKIKFAIVGKRDDMRIVAHNLFFALREFHDVEVIFSESFDEKEEGLAIMNRLKRASGGRSI